MRSVTFLEMPGTFAVCRLDPMEPIPTWAYSGELFSVTRTPEEQSIVCTDRFIPRETKHEAGWRLLKAKGPFAFDEIGIVASFSAPLAAAGVAVFIVSTFDTDYLFVNDAQYALALRALEESGHGVEKL